MKNIKDMSKEELIDFVSKLDKVTGEFEYLSEQFTEILDNLDYEDVEGLYKRLDDNDIKYRELLKSID